MTRMSAPPVEAHSRKTDIKPLIFMRSLAIIPYTYKNITAAILSVVGTVRPRSHRSLGVISILTWPYYTVNKGLGIAIEKPRRTWRHGMGTLGGCIIRLRSWRRPL